VKTKAETKGWLCHEIASHHFLTIEHAQELSTLFLNIATQRAMAT